MNDSPEELARSLVSLRQEHQRIVSQLRRDQERMQDIARGAWRIQEEERRRLARELHDGLGQSLTALKNDLATLLEDQPEDWRQRISSALSLCSDCLSDTREMSRLLRPPVLDDLGLEPALAQLARSISERSGTAVEIVTRGLPPELPTDLTTLLYRLIQEALNNTVKHARAACMLVRLVGQPDRIDLLMLDDGCGFDALQADECDPGFGLHAMRERVALFGGKIEIESQAGEGTRIRVSIPWRQRRNT